MASKQLMRAAGALHPKLILEPFDEYYRLHGFDAVYDMVLLFGGSTLYIPQIRTVFQNCLVTCAKNDWMYHGYSFYELARKYGWSERFFRRELYGV
jgi:Mor family transcriptional regulator